MRVEVTARDIKRGKRHSFWLCPLAKALTRASGKPAVVGSRSYGFNERNDGELEITRHPLTPEMSRFREAFDSGLPVQPFSFDLTF